MLDIFICEDNSDFMDYVIKTLESYSFSSANSIRPACATSNPYEILEYLSLNKSTTGLYFLDYDLGCDMNGMKLAEEIRKLDARGFIVFITADAESYKLTFQYMLEAMDYIVKDAPNLSERIYKCVDNAFDRLASRPNPLQKNLVLKLADDSDRDWKGMRLEKSSRVSVDSESILYFTTNPDVKHLITARTIDGSLEQRGSLREIEAKLDNAKFYRCQNNLIVNLDGIVDISKCSVVFVNGEEVEIASRQIKKLRERWQSRMQTGK